MFCFFVGVSRRPYACESLVVRATTKITMKTDLFVICDAATIHAGKLNILGTFDTIIADSVPCRHDSFTVAGIIRYAASEAGDHRIRVVIVNEDGGVVHEMLNREVSFSEPESSLHGSHKIRCTLTNQSFAQFGEYSVQLSVDAHLLAEATLFLSQDK